MMGMKMLMIIGIMLITKFTITQTNTDDILGVFWTDEWELNLRLRVPAKAQFG